MLQNDYWAILTSLLAIGAVIIIFQRCQTVLLGFSIFSWLNLMLVSNSAFMFTKVFGLDTYWITEAHRWVFTYSAIGLIAFTVGLYIAWRPIQKMNLSPVSVNRSHAWINERFIFLLLIISVCAYVLAPIAYRIPTVRAAWTSFEEFFKYSVLIAVIYGYTHKNYRPFWISFLIFLLFGLTGAVRSGHMGGTITFLLQILVVASFGSRLKLHTLLLFIVGLLITISLTIGWLDSRVLIRYNLLEGTSTIARTKNFASIFEFKNPLSLDVQQVRTKIHDRVDVSYLLAAQVRHQPAMVPYAYGKTVFPDIFAAWVPRFLWPNKSIQLGGSQFVSYYSGLFFASGTSVGAPYQFELYANGGALFVIAGLFILGFTLGKLELSLFLGNLSLPHFLGGLFLSNALANGAQTIVALAMQIVAGYIAVFILGKVLEKLNHSWHFWGTIQTPSRQENFLPVQRPVTPRLSAIVEQ